MLRRTGLDAACLLSQQPCCKQFSLARVRIERCRQYRSVFRDKREQPGKTNCCYEEEMYSEPGDVNALRNHLIMVGTDRWAVHCFRLALQPPRFPQAISAPLPKIMRRRAFDSTQGNLLAHSESLRLRDETACVVSARLPSDVRTADGFVL